VRGFGNAEDAQKALSLATDVSAGTGKDLATVSDALMKAANGSTGALSRRWASRSRTPTGRPSRSTRSCRRPVLKTFSGQAAVAAQSTAGQMRNAQIQFGEFQEQIGAALLPVLATLAGFMVETLIPAISSIASWMGENKEVLIAGFTGLAVVVGAVVIPAFIAWAVAAGAAAIATLAAAAPFILIGAAIAAAAFLIFKNWDSLKAGAALLWEYLQVAWNAISGVVGIAVDLIRAYIELLIGFWTRVWEGVQVLWDFIQFVWPAIAAVIGAAVNIIGGYIQIVLGFWTKVWEGAQVLWDVIRTVWNGIAAAIGFAVNAVRIHIDNMIAMFNLIKDAATAVLSWVTDKFNGIVNAIANVVSGVARVASDVANAIKAPVNAVLSVWNNLEFRIPTVHIPEVDIPGIGKVGGGQIGGQSFPFPDLPLLAGGGVLTAPTLFVGGEAGTEIVAPEAMLRAIVAEESRGGNYTLNLYPRTADASDVAYGFRRLEILAGLA
jgi:hypothetical protein